MTYNFAAQPTLSSQASSLIASGAYAASHGPLRSNDALTRRQESFRSVIAQHTSSPDRPREQTARESAQQFVALTFIQPLLKELRDASTAPPPFGPSKGEQQFRALLDAETAQQIASTAHFPLVDRLAHDLLHTSSKE